MGDDVMNSGEKAYYNTYNCCAYKMYSRLSLLSFFSSLLPHPAHETRSGEYYVEKWAGSFNGGGMWHVLRVGIVATISCPLGHKRSAFRSIFPRAPFLLLFGRFSNLALVVL